MSMDIAGWPVRRALVALVVWATASVGLPALPASATERVGGGTTVAFVPEPAWQTLSGAPVFTVPRPEVLVDVCVNSEFAEGPSFVLRLTGGDSAPVEETVSGGEFGVIDGVMCSRARWSPSDDLQWGAHYAVEVSAYVTSGRVGEAVSRTFELAPEVARPTELTGPVGLVTSNAPQFSASHAAASSEDVRLRFSISGALAVEGEAALDEDGRSSWQPDLLLPAGDKSRSTQPRKAPGQ